MNNCPKCGNPLQIGTTSCPICGTSTVETPATAPTAAPEVSNISAPATPAQAAPTAVTVEAIPAEQKVVQSAPVEQAITTASTTTTTVVSAPAPTTEPAVAPAPAPTAPTPSAPAEPAKSEPTSVQPAEQTSTVPTSIEPTSIAPTVTVDKEGSPVPSIPSSLNDGNTTGAAIPTVDTIKIGKKKNNKTTLLIIVILAVAAGIGAVMLLNGGNKAPNINLQNPGTEETALVTTSVSTNGYKLKLEDGWLINEDGSNVIITNSTETVAIKLDRSATNLKNLTTDNLEGYYKSNINFKDVKVSSTTISAKEAYLVDASFNETPVQVYYIDCGTSLTLGATIVYQTSESKTKYESHITEMIGTLSYSDDSIKALNSMQMYAGIFNMYSGAFKYQAPPVNEQTNTGTEVPTETPENGGQTNTETPVNGEQQNSGTTNEQTPNVTPAS